MSASLVGSEMCIRDRPAGGARGPVVSRGLERPGSGWAASAALVRRTPVSYTHLTLPTICSV
eukprot:11868206-Alexandrium_andersonii.AAC.1